MGRQDGEREGKGVNWKARGEWEGKMVNGKARG